MNVLVIEDQEVDARAASQMVHTAFPSAHVEFAKTLDTAEHQLADGVFDFVVVDLDLPDESGPATVARVRSKARELTIVVMTGDGADETLLACIANGADDYIVKGTMSGLEVARRMQIAALRHADYLERWFDDVETKDETWVKAVINDIAHELRTPLTSLMATAAALRADGEDERHQRIIRNVDRLAEAVEAIWSGVAGHVLMERISLVELLEEVGERANEKFIIAKPDDLIVVGQRTSLRRAFQLMLRIVSMEDGEPAISWRDTGYGVAEVLISTHEPDVFRAHPVMRVLVADYLRASLGKLGRDERGVVLQIPLNRPGPPSVSPPPMPPAKRGTADDGT